MTWLKAIFQFIADLFKEMNQPVKEMKTDVTPPIETVNPIKDEPASWMKIAKAEDGVHETLGSRHNPRIVEYHAATSLKAKDDETPWCSSFACWVVEKAGIKSPRSARAKDWMKWGKEITSPQYGCVCVFTRDGGGHVAFYVRDAGDSIVVLGGNQGNMVCEKKYPKANLLGYRWPESVPTTPVVKQEPPHTTPVVNPISLPWDGKHTDSWKWSAYLRKAIEDSKLLTLTPSDVPQLAKATREQRLTFWMNLFAIMAKHESNYKPETKYVETTITDGSGENVISRGLLQISIESARSYGNVIAKEEDLHDPAVNLSAGVRIMEKLVSKHGRLAGLVDGKWRGGSAYWSVLRETKAGKPRESYAAIMKHMRGVFGAAA